MAAVKGVTANAQHPGTGFWLSTVPTRTRGRDQRGVGRTLGSSDFSHRFRQVPLLSIVGTDAAESDAGGLAAAGVDAGSIGVPATPWHCGGQY